MTILNLIFLNFFIILISYIIGSIPSGYILSKYFSKIDITKEGSGNIGATNVLRSGSKKLALITLLFDAFKGILPILIFYNSTYSIILASLSAFIGHNYPIWLKFKGGKGVATYVGILFAINIYFGIIFTISWFVTFFISRYSSLSSLIGAASIPIYLLILTDFDQVIFFAIMFVLIFFTHRENIKRLKNKEETKTKIY